jgi:RNAse (barnase) inhibitor barstar
MELQGADYGSLLEPKAAYEIDGARFDSLEQFYDEVSAVIVPGFRWGRNLDAFNDLLRGGFGTPEGGFEIRWKNHQLSRSRLGHREMAKRLREMLRRSHGSHRLRLLGRLLLAHLRLGPTVFDELEEIIRSHGAGGAESSDGVRLLLE